MRRALPTLLVIALAAAPLAAVIDPFYRNRMEHGLRAFEQGDWEQAAHQLRIACFGHLDEPVLLVEGLVRLAVVHMRLGDEEAFRRTFSRLVELEERFSAYSAARLPQSVRRQFEGDAARLIPAKDLRTTAGFEAIAARAELQRLAALPPDRRRAELEARIAAEPERADWPIEMARLELVLDRPRVALTWLDRLPAEVAGRPPASCLRQQAASEAGDCGATDLSQPFCRNVPPAVVEYRLGCLVAAERWPEAAELLAELGPELTSRRRIARLQRRVGKKVGSTGEPTPATPQPAEPTAEAAVPLPAPLAEEPVEAPVERPAQGDPQEIALLRARLASAATQEELAALMDEAEALADRHPDTRQARLLAAEVAYLQSDWEAAVGHFAAAGPLGPEEAHLAFYRAVALYESGDPAGAAEVLRPVASRLERSEFVDRYLDRILTPGI